MRIGMLTPLDPRAAGVAEYSLDLLPYLASVAQTEIHVYSADPGQPGEGWVWHHVSQFEMEVHILNILNG